MSPCPTSDQLRQLLADRLAGPEAEAVEAHVERCAACQQALEQLTGNAQTPRVQGPASPPDSGAAFLRRLEQDPPTCDWKSPEMDSPSTLLAADRVGTAGSEPVPDVEGYEVLGEPVRGGMGMVCKARDTRLGRPVALKFLPRENAADAGRLQRFRREALAVSALNHPFICTLYDVGQSGGRPFLVMEWIEGKTLRDLAEQRLPLPEVVRLIGQVAQALAAAHAAGIVHRDIKPENIMVRADGFTKLVDFGLARPLPADLLQPGDAPAR
jgi:aminoglycoside phosphotransferase (APT) family kinase protein